MAVPLREDFDAAQARRNAAGCDDGNQARRLLSIAAIYDGMSRVVSDKNGLMCRWGIHSFTRCKTPSVISTVPPRSSGSL